MEKIKRVLLFNPPWDSSIGYGQALSKMTFVFPPIGLMYIASYIERQNKVQVRLFDSLVEKGNIIQEITNFKPEMVGITVQTSQFPIAKQIIGQIKEKFPEISIVIGGSHVSVLPREATSNSNIDFVVIGEGEETLSEIIKFKNGEIENIGDINGVAYNVNNEAVFTPTRGLVNLDSLPMPAVHLIDLVKYRCSPDNQIGNKTAVMTTSRGCPFACSFCAIKDKTRKSYRVRSINSIEEELDYYKKHEVDSLFIMDDIFTMNKNVVYSFCDLLEKKNYKFNWWAQTRADCVDLDMLKKMRKSGCSILSFGIESGSNRLLKLIKKNITIKQIRSAVKIARKVGIRTRGAFILGLPQETFLESLRTIVFGMCLPLHRAKYGLLVPYPGTEVWALALKEGKVKESGEDWERFSPMWGYTNLGPSYVPEGRNATMLGFLQRFANFIFYLKPDVIIDIISYYTKNRKLSSLYFAVRTFLFATFQRTYRKRHK